MPKMSPNENENLHSRILGIVLSLREYDQLGEWNEETRKDVQRMLSDLEYYTKREQNYYEKYREVRQAGL